MSGPVDYPELVTRLRLKAKLPPRIEDPFVERVAAMVRNTPTPDQRPPVADQERETA